MKQITPNTAVELEYAVQNTSVPEYIEARRNINPWLAQQFLTNEEDSMESFQQMWDALGHDLTLELVKEVYRDVYGRLSVRQNQFQLLVFAETVSTEVTRG